MASTLHVGIICATAIACTAGLYLAVSSLNHTILQAATIAGDKMSPRLQPTEHTVTVEGGVSVGNRKGSTFGVGMTVGKDRD